MSESPFDFKTPQSSHNNFEEFVKSKEEVLKQKIKQDKPQNRHLWVIVSVLMLSLIGLGVFSLLQKQDSDRQIASLQQGSVAGVSEKSDSSRNIITADGFSIVLDQPTPNGFKTERQTIASPYLDGKQAIINRFTATVQKDGKELTTGLEATVTEYDNKLDKSGFNEVVLKKLGTDYQAQSQDITIPKDIKLTKLSAANSAITYYTAVTSDNYYVIKITNQTAQYNDFAEISRFTDSLLNSLYLN